MFPAINPTPLLFTFAIMFGVLVHDMNIDKATKVAFAPPAAAASTAAAYAVDTISKSDHIHVERTSVGSYRSSVPKAQPPRDNDRQYIQNKKASNGNGDDHTHIWPSV